MWSKSISTYGCVKFLACVASTPLITVGSASNVMPPKMCIAASTRCVAKKRSAISPRKNGEMHAAIGPTVFSQPVKSARPLALSQPVIETYDAPQTKNCRNIITDKREPTAAGARDEGGAFMAPKVNGASRSRQLAARVCSRCRGYFANWQG